MINELYRIKPRSMHLIKFEVCDLGVLWNTMTRRRQSPKKLRLA